MLELLHALPTTLKRFTHSSEVSLRFLSLISRRFTELEVFTPRISIWNETGVESKVSFGCCCPPKVCVWFGRHGGVVTPPTQLTPRLPSRPQSGPWTDKYEQRLKKSNVSWWILLVNFQENPAVVTKEILVTKKCPPEPLARRTQRPTSTPFKLLTLLHVHRY